MDLQVLSVSDHSGSAGKVNTSHSGRRDVLGTGRSLW